MKMLKRLFGRDIVLRTVVGVLLGLLVVALFLAPWIRLPLLGAVWLLACYELLQMSRCGSSWRLVPQGLLVSAGMVVILLLFSVSWQWTLVLAVGVVATDVIALVVGRLAKSASDYSTHRFSVHSPSKTWEGVVGGVIGSAVFSCLAVELLGLGWSLYVIVLLVAVPLIAVWGDFFESRLKRDVGVKDASALLGPHGGIIDRLDSICPVFATVGTAVLLLIATGML